MTQQFTNKDYEDLREFVLWVVGRMRFNDKRAGILTSYLSKISDSKLYSIVTEFINKKEDGVLETHLNEWIASGKKVPKLANQ